MLKVVGSFDAKTIFLSLYDDDSFKNMNYIKHHESFQQTIF